MNSAEILNRYHEWVKNNPTKEQQELNIQTLDVILIDATRRLIKNKGLSHSEKSKLSLYISKIHLCKQDFDNALRYINIAINSALVANDLYRLYHAFLQKIDMLCNATDDRTRKEKANFKEQISLCKKKCDIHKKKHANGQINQIESLDTINICSNLCNNMLNILDQWYSITSDMTVEEPSRSVGLISVVDNASDSH